MAADDLKNAAEACAAKLQAKFPDLPRDAVLVLAFLEGSVHGMDVVRATLVASNAISVAKR